MSNGPWGISMKKLGGQMLGCRWTKLLPIIVYHYIPSCFIIQVSKNLPIKNMPAGALLAMLRLDIRQHTELPQQQCNQGQSGHRDRQCNANSAVARAYYPLYYHNMINMECGDVVIRFVVQTVSTLRDGSSNTNTKDTTTARRHVQRESVLSYV